MYFLNLIYFLNCIYQAKNVISLVIFANYYGPQSWFEHLEEVGSEVRNVWLKIPNPASSLELTFVSTQEIS